MLVFKPFITFRDRIFYNLWMTCEIIVCKLASAEDSGIKRWLSKFSSKEKIHIVYGNNLKLHKYLCHIFQRLDNAKMKYMHTGPQKARGRHRKFGDRVDLDNLREDIFTTEVILDEDGEGVVLHTGEVWVDCLERICKVVVADYLDTDKKTQTRKVNFASDRSLLGKDIFDLYRTRFQIEFLYRDGKSHMGLTHCQARNAEALDFSYNMSLSSINVMRKFARECGYEKQSIGSIKMLMHNAFMLEQFISISGKSPKLRKNDTDFKELLFLGVRDAA